MKTIKLLSYKDLIEFYGDPGTEEGLNKINKAQVKIKIPFPLDYGRNTITVMSCHEYCAEAYVDALQEILDFYGLDNLQRFKLNTFHGCHVIRQTRNHKWWSIHSWGMAFDHNKHYGEYGQKTIMPYYFINAFLKRGFGWGGRFNDGMHISTTGT
ncbi:MAG: M15 family metallopeptidase [Candidatus Lokiarchaeota archaeon]